MQYNAAERRYQTSSNSTVFGDGAQSHQFWKSCCCIRHLFGALDGFLSSAQWSHRRWCKPLPFSQMFKWVCSSPPLPLNTHINITLSSSHREHRLEPRPICEQQMSIFTIPLNDTALTRKVKWTSRNLQFPSFFTSLLQDSIVQMKLKWSYKITV